MVGSTYGINDERIFPRCLSASGPGVSEPGVDVLAYRIDDLDIADPPTPDELVVLGEAKHTLGSECSAPLEELVRDMRKTDVERVRDMLVLLQAYLEQERLVRFPERVSSFLNSRIKMALIALVDAAQMSGKDCLVRMIQRFDGRAARARIPIDHVMLAEVENLAEWIESTA